MLLIVRGDKLVLHHLVQGALIPRCAQGLSLVGLMGRRGRDISLRCLFLISVRERLLRRAAQIRVLARGFSVGRRLDNQLLDVVLWGGLHREKLGLGELAFSGPVLCPVLDRIFFVAAALLELAGKVTDVFILLVRIAVLVVVLLVVL